MTCITVWDGANCVGGNKILLQDDHLTLWLDFGLNMGLQMEYYEEFIQPQTRRGLYELLAMDLLPPVQGIYAHRFLSDYLWRDWHSQLDEVHGVLLSHAHLDHAGCLQYLHAGIPLYCSLESAMLLRALQDCGSGDYGTIVVRQFEQKDGGFSVLAWNRKVDGPHARYRQVCTPSPPGDDVQTFWQSLPGNHHDKCHIQQIQPVDAVNGHALRFIPLDHSIPGAGAWAVETSAGWVVYTGDIRFRGQSGHLSEAFLEETAKLQPTALILEGTRIGKQSSGYTEQDVVQHAMDILQKNRDRLAIVNFSMTHLERLVAFWQCAKELGRCFVVNPKDLYLLEAWSAAGRSLPLNDGSLLVYAGVGGDGTETWQKDLLARHAQQKVTAQEIARQPADYVLCFGYFDLNELPYLRVQDGVWIQSFSEPMSEEQRIDDARLNRWLHRFGFRRYPRQGTDEEVQPLHVSGHASGDELARVVEAIRPRRLIPVHTTEPRIFVERFSGICEVMIPETGKEIWL